MRAIIHSKPDPHNSPPHLTDERDWLLAHGMRITNVGLDDLSERLLYSLGAEKDDMTRSKFKNLIYLTENNWFDDIT